MTAMQTHDILVRGTGAAGLCTALALSRQGLAVALLGPLSEPAQADVRAYALNAASVEAAEPPEGVGQRCRPMRARRCRTCASRATLPGAALHFSAWQQSLSSSWRGSSTPPSSNVRCAPR
jgi:2-polyprenyl-6-methoxyphenol hydroxylase-like FAD-dependent oxidoreductase